MKTDMKDLIAKLLEDARRLQEIEPNAGTQARIDEAIKALNSN
ncbi:MAG: hypothetical protein ACRCZ3_11795 [Providencia rustigianii]